MMMPVLTDILSAGWDGQRIYCTEGLRNVD